MTIELREITMRNLQDCIRLEVDKEQKKFVASNMYSLAEAKADNISEPRAIYCGDTLVGFVMYDFDSATGKGWVSRLMIDKRYQGRGYARKAMEIVIKTLRSYEGCARIQTSFVPENSVAKGLYTSLGFILTGEMIKGEEVCIMDVSDTAYDNQITRCRQAERTMKKSIMTEMEMNYLIYLPDQFDHDKKWPLVVFLHGAGERGSDLELVKKHGLPKLVEEGRGFPFILISPQCPEYSWWTDKNLEVKAVIDEVTGLYPVDLGRVYITGLSMGGFGTFSMVNEFPGLFAAAIPICGGIKGNKKIKDAKNTLFWIFHGDADKTVKVEMSIEAAEAINSAGGNAKLTIYPGVGHDSWSQTYDNKKVYEWLLCIRRKS